jgi:hypothetical protein
MFVLRRPMMHLPSSVGWGMSGGTDNVLVKRSGGMSYKETETSVRFLLLIPITFHIQSPVHRSWR